MPCLAFLCRGLQSRNQARCKAWRTPASDWQEVGSRNFSSLPRRYAAGKIPAILLRTLAIHA